MKIGIVIEPYEQEGASGMAFFLAQLASNLISADTQNTYVLYASEQIAPEVIAGTFDQVRIPKGTLRKMLWFFGRKLDVDVLLFVAPLLALYPSTQTKTVLMCQELPNRSVTPGSLRARIEEWIRDTILMPLTVARASVVTTPTHATEKDILELYKKAKGKTKVIPHGFRDFSAIVPSEKLPEGVEEPFLFFTGRVKHRKNVHGIVSAFIEYRERTHSTVQLVIGGGYGGKYYSDMLEKLKEHGLEGEVHFIGFVTEAELLTLYKKCTAFLFPSLSEGFGMPLLEAMSLGVPVVTSSISSMPEVAGDSALLVDPYSIADMSEAFERIATDTALRAELIKKGLMRASEFTWEKCAQDFLMAMDRGK